MSARPRPRDLGLAPGTLPSGPTASVLDVPGVGLGHATLVRDEPAPPLGRGTARTGVTCLLLAEDAYRRPVPAGGAVLNGAGECTGFLSAAEWGAAETPVYLTSTMQLGRVYDAACTIALEGDAGVADDVVIPVVGECDDSWLNDCRRMQVTEDDVRAAHAAAVASVGAAAPPPTGAVGAGTGMSCLGFKGGIGTASRVLPDGTTVAVLLLTNFGTREELRVDGVAVGRAWPSAGGPGTTEPDRPAGSCLGLVVTDAPVDGAGCARLARRIGLGLARVGSVAHHGSGEIFLGFSTGLRLDRDQRPDGPARSGRDLDPLFTAVVDATEEAVYDSLLSAPTTVGRDGHVSEGLDAEVLQGLLRG
ncbi:P1 family peptidase [Nocardioides sp. GY 10127]|uniref:P1 family peptidase n=1 Tax=Nocardioides sp. GY 10127 TaxID=2569762 RepID=UPI0010A86D07|nr:P1 family peptidase [Nocardioides sp. GY 10127]TIC86602.1 S58 family peptidase [Nocardioides sp. GY 10127]